MALTIVVRSGDSKAPPVVTFDSPRVVIGRGEGCDVRLPDPSVSHRHASLRQRGTEYIVLDEGSTNGTFVGPVRLSPQAPRVVRSGDLIRIGRIWLEIRIEHVPPTRNPNLATREIALGLVADALAAEGEAAAVKVRVVEGPDAGRELDLVEFERPYVLGRGQGVELVLDDADASRRHVALERRGSQIFVRDLGSKNGAQLGERRLEPNKDTVWTPGTPLRVGTNRLTFEDPVGEALAELERAADEHLRADDSVDPPDSAEVEAPAADPIETPAPSTSRAEAPIARTPRRAPPEPRRRAGWGATDVVVALIAVAVLALSVVGLVWLFRAK